jgi:hypothetical protein
MEQRSETGGRMKRIIGRAMLATPYAILIVLFAQIVGLIPTLVFFGGTLALIVWVFIAFRLLEEA